MIISDILVILTAYFIGAIPTAYIVGQRWGINLRQSGDGNLGGLNTLRTLGWKPAIIVGLIDIGKGAFATWFACLLASSSAGPYFAALACAIGHDFSIYIRFQGGQGMAAIGGSMLILHPIEALIGIGITLLLLLIIRNWNISCVFGFLTTIFLTWYLGASLWQIAIIVMMVVTIGVKKWLDMPLARRIRENHS